MESKIENVVGENIRKIRRDQNYTQQDIAKVIGVNRSVVNRYESGLIKIPLDKLEEIARFLNVSPIAIMGLENVQAVADERKHLHSLVDQLPSEMLTKAEQMLKILMG